ncbi:hypothetical protein BDA96_02G336900 [Sorghum bicolor]|uniref:Uncharacterized protein n=1 Tax=Sorghum bicolor TaxID=4558 RepID=A0A921RSN4_SORBI|nr:hypothetical protein BDA96_02G336900 [Sorghum bicolor]
MEPTQAHPCTARQLHDLCEASCQVQRASENNITGSLAPQWTVPVSSPHGARISCILLLMHVPGLVFCQAAV